MHHLDEYGMVDRGATRDHLRDLPARATRVAVFLLSSLSVASLLLYFLGIDFFSRLASTMLVIETAGLLGVSASAVSGRRRASLRLVTSGLWAGGLATLAYDVARIPVAHAGVPVFKAISYFGTVFVGAESPTVASEVLGWGYHLTNGVSFGLMYVALVRRPRVYSAVIWGLTLEALMLLTPYAEVFGYRRDAKFLAVTAGAHVVYGLALWLALRLWEGAWGVRLRPSHVLSGFVCAPLGLALIAADFHARYARELPPSPPSYVGPRLYTTWNVPEPDRVVAMWLLRRSEPQARFYFIKPFEPLRYGKPFDVPEASVRRHGAQSATQFLVEQQGLGADAKLETLARMTYLNEVTPWMLASDPEAGRLTDLLRGAADRECGASLNEECAERLFSVLDEIYERP